MAAVSRDASTSSSEAGVEATGGGATVNGARAAEGLAAGAGEEAAAAAAVRAANDAGAGAKLLLAASAARAAARTGSAAGSATAVATASASEVSRAAGSTADNDEGCGSSEEGKSDFGSGLTAASSAACGHMPIGCTPEPSAASADAPPCTDCPALDEPALLSNGGEPLSPASCLDVRLPRDGRFPVTSGSLCSPGWLLASTHPKVPQSAGPRSVTHWPNLEPRGSPLRTGTHTHTDEPSGGSALPAKATAAPSRFRSPLGSAKAPPTAPAGTSLSEDGEDEAGCAAGGCGSAISGSGSFGWQSCHSPELIASISSRSHPEPADDTRLAPPPSSCVCPAPPGLRPPACGA